MSNIHNDSPWIKKETKQKVFVIWSSCELVTYQEEGSKTLIAAHKSIFLQDFEKAE